MTETDPAGRRVLIVTYFFPPIGGTAVLRMVKFAKYLPEYGWHADILTSLGGRYVAGDEGLLRELPEGTRIYRTRGLETRRLMDRVRGGARAVRRIAPRRRPESVDPAGVSIDGDEVRRERAPRPGLALLPDDFVGWIPAAVRMGLRAIRERRPRAILSTSSPYTSHFVGKRLHEKTGLPWIADFRDPWFFAEPGAPLTRRQRFDFRFEKKILAAADRVVNTSDPWGGFQKRRHGYAEDDPKFITIPNGYDEDDIIRIARRENPQRIRIAYLGTLRDHRSPREFLIALRRVKDRRPELCRNLGVEFVGGMFDPPGVPPNSELVRRLGLEEMIEVRGYVPHGELAGVLEGLSALLLIIGNYPMSEGTFSGKIFEYLGSGLPVFAVVPEGVAKDLIEETGAGETAPYGDARGIADSLERFLARLHSGPPYPEPSPGILQRYTRRNLTGRLAELLDELAARSSVA